MSAPLPRGWAETTLGAIHLDLSKMLDPRRQPTTKFELYSVPRHELGEPEVVEGKSVGSSKRTVTAGTVLLCRINPRINRVWLIDNDSEYIKIASTEWIPFFPLPEVEPRFLAYFLQRDAVRDFGAANASGVGGSLMRVKASTFLGFPFPVPPRREQARIADTLDQVLADLRLGNTMLKRMAKSLRLYRASVLKAAVEGDLTADWRKKHPDVEPASKLLQRILAERRRRWEQEQRRAYTEKGKALPKNWKAKYKEPVSADAAKLQPLPEVWSWASLDQLGRIDRGRSKHRPRNSSFLYGGRYPFVQTGDVKRAQRFIRDHTQTYSEAGLKQSRLWPPGTLCITIAANIAETAILSYPSCFPDSIVGVLFDPSLVSVEYVELFMQSARSRISAYAPATAQKNINNQTLRKLAVPLPPMAEQRAIVATVEEQLAAIDETAADIGAKLKGAESLRQSILHSAFTGNLLPQNPNDEPASKLLKRIAHERKAPRR